MRIRAASSFLVAIQIAAIASAAAGETRNLEIVLTPPVPTWSDAVLLSIEGESDCSVLGMSAEIKGDEIPATVHEECEGPRGDFHHFLTGVSLLHLAPGFYRLTAVGTDEPSQQVERDIQAYAASTVAVLPSALRAGEPSFLHLEVNTSGSCDTEATTQLDGDVVRVVLDENCWAPAAPYDAVLRYALLPALASGDYELQVVQLGTPPKLLKQPLHVYPPDGCMTTDIALCLHRDRFRVQASWKGFQGGAGIGHPIAVDGRPDTGLFWFFDEANLELTVKVLDGCGVNDHYWVFIASGSTVEYEVTVTDTDDDEVKTYRNELGHTPRLIADTTAFACP